MNACRMCLTRPAGAKAHILPAAWFREIGDVDDAPRLVSFDKDYDDKLRRTGTWDDRILCRECEHRFSKYDDYGVKALRKFPEPHSVWPESSSVQELRDVDPIQLKLFFLHILWRAHECKHHEFKDVILGERAEALRALLLADSPGGPNDFDVLLLRYDPGPPDLQKFMTTPLRRSWANDPNAPQIQSDFYEFQVQLWAWRVTLAASGMPPGYDMLAIRPGRPVPVIMCRCTLTASPQFGAFIEYLRQRGQLPGPERPS